MTSTLRFDSKKPGNSSKLALILISLALIALFVWTRFIGGDGKGWRSIISSDGIGYYAYLPSLIIYSDPSWEKFTSAERKFYGRPDYNPKYLSQQGTKQINKYFSGEAILLLPFFVCGWFFSWISGGNLDGLSFWFQFFAGLGSLFYLFVGINCMRKILLSFSFSEDVTAFVMLAVLAGTNLFYYSLGQPSMSHTFSFFAVTAFIWTCMQCNDAASNSLRFRAGFLLAFIILLRPVNILVLAALPLFLKGTPVSAFLKKILPARRPWFLFALIALLALQPLLWHLQSGQWIIRSYPDEGFYFMKPHIADFLFSFRRGWFVYTPLMLLPVIGIFHMPGQKHRNIPVFFLFLFLVVYTSSSWWCWYYSDGFGQRPMIDFYGIFAVLIASTLSRTAGEKLRLVSFFFVYACICLNLFQTWQYSEGYIGRDNMNRVKYFHVFLRTSYKYRECFGGGTEVPFYKADLDHPLASFENSFDKPQPNWINQDPWMLAACKASGKKAFLFTKNCEFGPGIEIHYGCLSKVPSPLYCEIGLKLYDSIPEASNQAMFVVAIDSINRSYNYYNAFRLNEIPLSEPGTWRPVNYSFNLPRITNPNALLKLYLWNPGKGTFMADDMEIRVYGKSE
ncbi:MAG: hypothetical protein NTU51_11045 [Bacteroidetes bacterium]|nr:hypothetical protein [Bacteroidota bacterium]